MAEVRAFKAVRPKPGLEKQISAPPYDVISAAEAREMARGNGYSFLRVTRSEIELPEGTDPYSPEVYGRAAANYQKLLAEGALVRDESECVYLYSLEMNGRVQTGLAVCLSVDDYLNGVIKKHELTRRDKEDDRTRHIERVGANTGPVFMAYRADARVKRVTDEWVKGHEPLYDFVADDGVAHKVWRVDDAGVIAEMAGAFEGVTVYIADGHHRNASAARVAERRRGEENRESVPGGKCAAGGARAGGEIRAAGGAGSADGGGACAEGIGERVPGVPSRREYDYYLAVMFPDDELEILPYNRVVKDLNGLAPEEFLEKLGEKFDVSPCPRESAAPERHSFGLYLRGKWHCLKARPAALEGKDAIGLLDVSILQDEALDAILGIGDPRTDKRIDFVGGIRGLGELERRVDSGEMALAFAMYPTSMGELMGIADRGEIMPPKSTWFEPKLRSGLVVHEV